MSGSSKQEAPLLVVGRKSRKMNFWIYIKRQADIP